MNITTRLIAAAALWCSMLPATAVNIVQNPGFEQGAATWQHSEHFVFTSDGLWAHSDPFSARLTYCAVASCIDTLFHGAYISQLLNTRIGDSYDLSFFVRSFSGESSLSVFWDGTLLSLTGTPNGPMRKYTFSGLVSSANATLLEIHGANRSGEPMSFDDFSVMQIGGAAPPPTTTPSQAITEPGAYALLLAALGAMVIVKRRRRS
jgi:hypothetical protein